MQAILANVSLELLRNPFFTGTVRLRILSKLAETDYRTSAKSNNGCSLNKTLERDTCIPLGCDIHYASGPSSLLLS